ncbi:MAG TPA: FecR domain-containing protein [Puia sp.]|jgi:ferric-dicitrate binding protein FerR (iron transport regulator)
MDNKEKAAHLLRLYLTNKISSTELNDLNRFLLDESYAGYLQSALSELIEASPALPDYQEEEWESLYQKIRHKAIKPHTIPPYKRRSWLIAAATIMVMFTGGAVALMLRSGNDKASRPVADRIKPASNDIGPGGNKATLTLADGSTIDLDQANNGTIRQQGRSQLVKVNGDLLAYKESRQMNKEEDPNSFNKISTPRGGKFQLVLPDGSKVWLNAASSLTYPTTFAGKDRSVQLQGEAYFEIAPNAAKPFKVNHDGLQIEVLGTSFNIMAYKDEQAVRTTLLEGRIRVHNGGQAVLLSPGQQARSKDNQPVSVAAADLEEAVAWKNGVFRFNESTIEEVMRQISRWYDVDVVYGSSIPKDLFRGEIYRNVNVSAVLKVLEVSGVHFRVEGKKIFVLS